MRSTDGPSGGSDWEGAGRGELTPGASNPCWDEQGKKLVQKLPFLPFAFQKGALSFCEKFLQLLLIDQCHRPRVAASPAEQGLHRQGISSEGQCGGR